MKRIPRRPAVQFNQPSRMLAPHRYDELNSSHHDPNVRNTLCNRTLHTTQTTQQDTNDKLTIPLWYFEEKMPKWSIHAVQRCRQFRQLREDYLRRVTNPTARTHPLIESLFRSPMVSITKAARDFEVSYKTVQRELDKLVQIEILQETPNWYPKVYVAHEVLSIAFGN
ncbi:hypothetical protein SH668x_003776 [Planctomicrobium sp. SH668]|uniref:hypothetical protein n=1 Tax=Planctomicrobium sp. SH668 TaxID=3448126 RepID=UPI003F5B3A44